MRNTSDEFCPKDALLLSGLDSLFLGYSVDSICGALDFDELEYQKQLRRDDRDLTLEPIQLGSRRFLLKPNGRHPYKYILTNEEWELQLTERMHPNFYMRYSSKALWLRGVQTLHAEFEDWLESLGLRHVRRETISRADYAFDFALSRADFDVSKFVSLATKNCTWRQHNGVQTIQFGTGSTVVRIYDKVAEIKQESDKYWFFDLWGQSDDVWRIEAQIRGPRLKKGGIRTLEDLDALTGDLLREVFSKHTTLRMPTADPNRSRWPLAPLWHSLQGAIAQIPQTGLVEAYDPKQDLEWRRQKASQSLYGYLKHYGCLVAQETGRGADLTLEELCELLPDCLEHYYFPADWKLQLERRLKALEVEG